MRALLFNLFLMMLLPWQLLAHDRLCINLMFLNDQAVPDSKISPASTMFPMNKSYGADAMRQVKKWLELNPEDHTTVQFWYDGSKVPETAVEGDLASFKRNLSESEQARFSLKDIRKLDAVKNEYSMFFADDVVTYFRTDILRFLLAETQLKSSECDTYLYADLNVTPESRAELFDSRTVGFLDDYGIVMMRHRASEHSSGGHLGFENKFMMLRNDNVLFDAIHEAMFEPLKEHLSHTTNVPPQSVYDLIPTMFLNLFHRKGKIMIDNFKTAFDVKNYNFQHRFFLLVEPVISDPHDKTKKYSSRRLTHVTINYYYTDEEIDEKILKDINSTKARQERKIKNNVEEIADLEAILKDTTDPKKVKTINRQLSELKKDNEDGSRKLEDLSNEGKVAEMIKAARLKELKGRIEEDRWPPNLVIPAKVMIAPQSHFG